MPRLTARLFSRAHAGKGAAMWLVLVLVIAVAGGAAAYYVYLQSPGYAAKQMLTAMEHHDAPAFEKRVDVDALANDLVSTGMTRLPDVGENPMGRAGGGLGGLLGGLMQGMQSKIQDQIAGRVASEIRNRVGEGTFSWDQLADLDQRPLKDVAADIFRGEFKPCLGVSNIYRDADEALVTLDYGTAPNGRKIKVVVRMAQQDKEWRVIALDHGRN
ncbi:MAG: DUF2939 domain-containing protein [bacterium]